jgi:mannose-6-phosphate isomerase-like protein (cupin superfamily)
MEASGGERLEFGGITIVVHAGADATGGAFSVLEEVPPLADTPLHIHTNEDEFFYAVESEHVITVGEREHRLAPGQGVFAPRGIPHAQRRVEQGVGRILIVVSPGGFEGFFLRLSMAHAAGNLDAAAYAAASEEYGITWL